MRSHPWAQYVLVPASQIPPDVGRCSICGGGRWVLRLLAPPLSRRQPV